MQYLPRVCNKASEGVKNHVLIHLSSRDRSILFCLLNEINQSFTSYDEKCGKKMFNLFTKTSK